MKKFRRTLSNHLTGVDGRVPFDPEEEGAILKVLRVRRPWPCVPEHRATNGSMSFRSRGYHEKHADGLMDKNLNLKPAAAPSSDHKPESILFSFDLPGIIDVPSPDEVLLKGWLHEST
jgi:hypothetical protein